MHLTEMGHKDSMPLQKLYPKASKKAVQYNTVPYRDGSQGGRATTEAVPEGKQEGVEPAGAVIYIV